MGTKPSEVDAIRIFEKVTGDKVKNIFRFPTGKAHYVYEIATKTEKKVIRITKEEWADIFAGAIYWYPILEKNGVPLPMLRYAELDSKKYGFPYMIMDRLPGKDLGDVYAQLTTEEKKKLAQDIAAFQFKIQKLPMASGFGYARSYRDPKLQKSWIDVVYAHLERSRARILDESIISFRTVEQVRKLIERYRRYFEQIKPIGFLDDTTTKNVIIDKGKLKGVVDIDYVCFGDITQLLGLINMALLEKKYTTDYVGFLADELDTTREQKRMINLYTVLYGLDFLTTHGHVFNKTEKVSIEGKEILYLKKVVNEFIGYL